MREVAGPAEPRKAGPLRGARWALDRRRWAMPDRTLLTGLLLGLAAAVEILVATGGPSTSDGSTALLLNLLATVPMALRRRFIPAVAGVVTAANALLLAANLHWTVAGIVALLWSLYLLGAHVQRRALLLLPCLPFALNAVSPFGGEPAALFAVVLLVLVVAALALGDARRLRGQAIAERDSSRQAMLEAQRDQAALAERARIARELHDVVAHHVSMIAIQADTARLATPGLPEQGRERLEAIGDTARDTMSELRSLLGVLRSEEPGAGLPGPRSPQPGLDQLAELVESARAAGTPVRLTVGGPLGPLPPGVDLSAYRIVQEALTNARRHAPGAEVEVELHRTAAMLVLRVRDHGPGPLAPADGAVGHGLLGMRERAAMVGGGLRAGGAAGGGFLVEAELPLRRPEP
jgi:signal transduction histidine kinase